MTRAHGSSQQSDDILKLQIRIKAFHGAAPKTSQLVTDLARRGGGYSLRFYRHEHAAKVQVLGGVLPHSLIQGIGAVHFTSGITPSDMSCYKLS
jgi:hypothetical protein